MLFKALKTGFEENKGQSGPLSVDSKTQGKCQLSVKIVAICQLSVNPIQTLMLDAILWRHAQAPSRGMSPNIYVVPFIKLWVTAWS